MGKRIYGLASGAFLVTWLTWGGMREGHRWTTFNIARRPAHTPDKQRPLEPMTKPPHKTHKQIGTAPMPTATLHLRAFHRTTRTSTAPCLATSSCSLAPTLTSFSSAPAPTQPPSPCSSSRECGVLRVDLVGVAAMGGVAACCSPSQLCRAADSAHADRVSWRTP